MCVDRCVQYGFIRLTNTCCIQPLKYPALLNFYGRCYDSLNWTNCNSIQLHSVFECSVIPLCLFESRLPYKVRPLKPTISVNAPSLHVLLIQSAWKRQPTSIISLVVKWLLCPYNYTAHLNFTVVQCGMFYCHMITMTSIFTVLVYNLSSLCTPCMWQHGGSSLWA